MKCNENICIRMIIFASIVIQINQTIGYNYKHCYNVYCITCTTLIWVIEIYGECKILLFIIECP